MLDQIQARTKTTKNLYFTFFSLSLPLSFPGEITSQYPDSACVNICDMKFITLSLYVIDPTEIALTFPR